MLGREPSVSVIMATYNRSNLLPMVVRTVLWQTLEDWELWVVGDACTDDTEAVVCAFDDPRIHFINLPTNCGDQSGPNNEGMQRARGKYIAFLNHDDFWMPDHLQQSTDELARRNADLVYPMMLLLDVDGSQTIRYAPKGRDDARAIVTASCWVFRRELIEEIGGWRHYSECYGAPSQQWLHRVRQEGYRVLSRAALGIIIIPSGSRDRAYAKRATDEHRVVFDKLVSDYSAFRQGALADSAWKVNHIGSGPMTRLGWSLIYAFFNLAARFGLKLPEPPGSLWGGVVRGVMPAKGKFIRRLRRNRGLT